MAVELGGVLLGQVAELLPAAPSAEAAALRVGDPDPAGDVELDSGAFEWLDGARRERPTTPWSVPEDARSRLSR